MEKEGKINLSILIFFPTIYLAMLKVYTKFEDFGSHRSREICDRNLLLERKKNGQIKGLISRRRLILSYTIQEVIPNICTKFQNPRCSSSWEIFDEKKSLHTHTHTHNYWWKDKNYIPPTYFVCRGYNYFMTKTPRKICGQTEDRTHDLLNTRLTAHPTDLAGSARCIIKGGSGVQNSYSPCILCFVCSYNW